MHQLLQFSPEQQGRQETVKQRHSVVENVAFNELWQILLDVLNSLDKTCCVVDALDELDSDQTASFLGYLVGLGQMRPGAVKLIMTSRPLPQIQKILNTPSFLQVRLEDRNANHEIALFIDYRLSQTFYLSVPLAEFEVILRNESGDKSAEAFKSLLYMGLDPSQEDYS